ncbi:DUF4124 domain-containing protein [Pseudoxanthomonas daejeonensis]|uniref:DUF4124 domain-containing protein n=1 Tax=Pseudoxanthomonas daejeonensis TaxID=266062 RepID=A0ABQ6ZBM8_9GAMM|nr:DUF4124 domain-containing protein [Pseudoxanthomonas daejeonensis]KAF1697357.1 hypothetical protein CSC65_00300 [Pseudoxanthomonas daejeonensis]UNK58500.1 DUF4124 domain-containing protein [Pseudoxanthomonas daejeonensis]
MFRLNRRFFFRPMHVSLVLLLCTLAGTAAAQGTTIYRCTDAAGELTVQNRPCPAGSTQRQQQVQGVSSAPAGATPTAAPLPAPAAMPPPAPVPAATAQVLTDAAPTALQTIYRCTDAAGNLTVQNLPCPSGTTQRQQQVQGVSNTPARAPTASPTPPAPATTDSGGFVSTSTGPEPRILDSANLPRTPPPQAPEPDPGRLPPPPLFRCTTYDNDAYLSEEQEQPPRCLALRTVGLDGNPAGGAGRACEVVRDRCARVPDGSACEAWHRYAREAESRFRFAHPDNVERRRIEYERLAKIVGESCG